MATGLQQLGTGSAHNLSILIGFVPKSGVTTGVIGGRVTAAWDGDASCVLTYDSFKVAPLIQITQQSGAASGEGAYMLTGVGTNTCGVRCLLSSVSTASAADFGFVMFGLADR